MKSLVVWLTVVPFVSATVAFAGTPPQEITSFEVARQANHYAGYYSFDGNGRLKTSRMQSIANTNAKFFEDEVIQAEIELVDHQRPEYLQITRQWHESWEETFKRMQAANQPKQQSQEFNLQMLVDNDEKSLEKIRQLLLPHQFAIVNELQFRCLFRTHGLGQLLANEELGKMLEISPQERTAIATRLRELKPEIAARSVNAAGDAIKTLIKPLTEKQRELFVRKWAHLFSTGTPVSVEELMVFFDPGSNEWIRNRTPPLRKYLDRPRYETGAAGNLVQRPERDNNYRNEELQVFRELWKHPGISEFLALSEIEKTRVDEFVRESGRSSQVIFNLSVAGSQNTEIPFEMQKKQAYDEADAIEKQSMSDIRGVLGKPRWERVLVYADRINVASAGPVFDLLEGELAGQLGLTESQKLALKESAAEARIELIEASGQIEEFLLEELFARTDKSSGEKMKKLFGKPVRNAPANISLLLMQQ